MDTPDIVNNPDHYTRFTIQPIEFITENELPWHTGNIVKYALRAGFKLYPGKGPEESEIIDLQKVIRNAQVRIDHIGINSL
tara:strand:+ start:157 stop:399 length:243 start_codon:yes stop_codon:yes gene_type:complete